MREHFSIASVHGGRRLEFLGAIPRSDEPCTFAARLTSPTLNASVDVYDLVPQRWAGLFHELAKSWRGWSGEKVRESLEGHLRLACTSDRTGHVSIQVSLRSISGDDWRVEATIYVEAGQLDMLSREAAEYFR